MCAETSLPPHPTIAAVLAGGLGTRLRSVVSDKPKVLALAAGQPFLAYVMAYLASQGVNEVILCVGYMAGQVRSFAQDGRRWGLRIRYSEESAPLGTGGALRLAFENVAGPLFVLNGDTLFLAGLQALWRTHCSLQVAATLALLRVQDGQGRGLVAVHPDGRIKDFDEKPETIQPVEGPAPALINAGLYLMEPSAIAEIEPGQAISLERQLFPSLAGRGQLAGDIQQAYFVDIGAPQSLAAFEQDVTSGTNPALKALRNRLLPPSTG